MLRTKRVVTVFLVVLFMGTCLSAANWVGSALGAKDIAAARVGYLPTPTTQVGLTGYWFADPLENMTALAAYGTFDVIPDVNLPLAGIWPFSALPLPESYSGTLYIGAQVGAGLHAHQSGIFGGPLAGFRLKTGSPLTLAVEWQYAFAAPTVDAAVPDRSDRVLLNIEYRF